MSEQNRILIVDDNQGIHEDLKQILKKRNGNSEIAALEDDLFDDEKKDESDSFSFDASYKIDDAYQGGEAIEMVEEAEKQGFPYALVFMDVRMPPGIDGIKTIAKIWDKHPDIEMIICTAFSDYSWNRIVRTLRSIDHLFFMKKPFNSLFVKQTVWSLIHKWESFRENKAHLDKIEKELTARKTQLDEIAVHLEDAKKQAEKIKIDKNGFLSTINLDVRTSIDGIIGMTDLLLGTDLDEEQKAYAETIKASGDSTLMIIDDVINCSNIQTGKIDIQEIIFNLRTTVENVVELMTVTVDEKGLELATLIYSDVPEILIGDPVRLRQILMSILSNIAKFIPASEIVISVSSDSESSTAHAAGEKGERIALRFEVSLGGGENLTGKQEEMVNLFVQSDTSENINTQDTGMGLAISRQLIELMNGTTGFEKHDESGGAIWFTVEFEIAVLPEYEHSSFSKTITGIRCLIISDSPTISKILALHIDHWGGRCSETESIEGAIDKLHTAMTIVPFDIVIVNYKDDNIDLYQKITLEIRRHEPLKNIHFICISSTAKKDDAIILKDHGYSAFLTKPVKKSHLYNCLLMIKDTIEKGVAKEQAGIITKYIVDEFVSDRYRALIVEDSIINQKLLVRLLERMSIRCDVASNGKDAIASLSKKKYDMIFMDCHMPGMDGYKTTKILREKEKYLDKSMPILAITADSTKINKERCLKIGMNEFITKPYNIDEIASAIKKCVKVEH